MNYLFTAVACALPVLAQATAEADQAEHTRPNIIWIFTDDHATQAISAYGGPIAELAPTPGIDRLADEGICFDRSYVANSLCGPSRACIISGQHSHKNGVFTNNRGGGRLDYDKVLTFPQILQENGYTTGIVGKWHLESDPQGFDEWAVLDGQGEYYNTRFFVPSDNGQGHQTEEHPGRHSTKLIMEKSLAYLDRVKDGEKPFMLMCQFKAPHRTWLPQPDLADFYADTVFPEPETFFDDYATRGTAAHKQEMEIGTVMRLKEDLKFQSHYPIACDGFVPEETYTDPELRAHMLADNELYQKFYSARQRDFESKNPTGAALPQWKYQAYLQDYLACVKGVDLQVARLLKYLDDNGLAENTIIAYSSDQGFYLGEHGWFDKRFMYEESFRTPLLVRWPGHIKPGSRNEDLVQNIDIAPTLLEIAGLAATPEMDGISILPLLEGKHPADWRKSLYYHYYEFPGAHSVRRHEGVGTERYKLIRFYGEDLQNGEEWELYDLQNDPQELHNIYANPEMSEVVKELKDELAKLKRQYEVPDHINPYPNAVAHSEGH